MTGERADIRISADEEKKVPEKPGACVVIARPNQNLDDLTAWFNTMVNVMGGTAVYKSTILLHVELGITPDAAEKFGWILSHEAGTTVDVPSGNRYRDGELVAGERSALKTPGPGK